MDPFGNELRGGVPSDHLSGRFYDGTIAVRLYCRYTRMKRGPVADRGVSGHYRPDEASHERRVGSGKACGTSRDASGIVGKEVTRFPTKGGEG